MNSKIVVLEETDEWRPQSPADSDWAKIATQLNGDANHNGAGLIINKAAYTVYLQGTKILFPKKEFELLLLLASNPRKVFKRVEILQKIWGEFYKQTDSRSLDVHIRMLRKKLHDHYITTIRGVGYKLEK